jgi:hypothetical protein
MIRVGILTTRSVVTIQRIEPEAHSSRSVMCINRTAVETGVSRAYNQFVSRGTGVISKLTGVAAFRTDVDGEVTDGRSFELAVMLAHLLRRDRELATASPDDGAAEVWLATGEVDADHRVNRVDGISQKLKVLEEWLAAAPANRPAVSLLLPAANRADAAPLVAAIHASNVRVRFIDRVDQAFDAPNSEPTGDRAASSRSGLAALVVVVLGIAGLGLWTAGEFGGPVPRAVPGAVAGNDSPPGPVASAAQALPTEKGSSAAVSTAVVVRDFYSASSCYGGERLQVEHRVAIGGELTLPSAGRRCRLEVHAEGPSGVPMHAYLVARDGVRLAPTYLGANGSLLSQVAPGQSVLELAFSTTRLGEGADASTLARIVLLIKPS